MFFGRFWDVFRTFFGRFSDVFRTFLDVLDVFGRFSDVSKRISDVFGCFSNVFRTFSDVFGRFSDVFRTFVTVKVALRHTSDQTFQPILEQFDVQGDPPRSANSDGNDLS